MANNNTKNKVGRPTKFTPETVNKLEQAFSLDATVNEACYYADVSKEAYYNFLEREPEYVDRFARLRNKPVLAARESVISNFKNDPTLALKYLERKVKHEFSLRQELTGKNGKDLPTPILGGMSKDVPSDDSDIQTSQTKTEN